MALLIRSPKDLNAQKRRREELEVLIADHGAKLRSEGKSPEQVERRLRPLRLKLQEVNDLIELYRRLSVGDTSVLEGMEVGVKLIGARIAAGHTQRKLAELLGVAAAQVARDEVNEYRTASMERFQQVAKVLGVKVDLRFHGLVPASVEATPVQGEDDVEHEGDEAEPAGAMAAAAAAIGAPSSGGRSPARGRAVAGRAGAARR